jgi:hypothetical protein
VEEEGQDVHRGQQRGERLLAVAEVMFPRVAPVGLRNLKISESILQ